ncbi:MAG: hypothetical protein AB8B91_08970 [Rubripirellula sp.]
MASSNVRNIDSLEAFHAGIVGLSDDWNRTLQEVRMVIHRAETYFTSERPSYWRHQKQLADRELTESKDNLAEKRAAIRPADRPAATEAAKRVRLAEQRVRECDAKIRLARSWSLEISTQCNDLLGPLADVIEHCEVILPTAATELRSLIEQLRAYAEQGKRPNG